MKANYNFEVIRNEKKQEKLKEVIKNFDLNNASMVILYRYYLMKLMPLFDGEIPDLSQRIDDDFCDAMAMETAGFVSDAVNNAVSAFIENDGKESFRVDYDGTEDVHGSTMYVTLYPCNECAKAIIQSGIKKVIFLDNKYKNTENNIAARFLFKTAGIETVQYTKSSREVSLSL